MHAQTAAAELAAALSALLDAGALMASGQIASNTPLAPLQRGLAGLRQRIEPDSVRDGGSLLRTVAEALDAEISRWEERSRQEPDARAVLRAFLGVRELLWELGVRVDETGEELEESPAEEPTELAPEPRIQRVAVEG
ncbi:MAG: hypothetical protein CL910_03710 [Deltaproteobacteria bacterium]|nr:hypothetical protein [Deltaproteobacteria bacterium]